MNHPYKLGKLAPVHDERTLQFRSVLKPRVKIPASFAVDQAHPGCRPHMFLNDEIGDCVMAGRAELQMRLDLIRTGKVPTITDAEVKKEYFKETGNVDSGLDILNSLKAWQKGWTAGGRKEHIKTFGAVNWKDPQELRQAIFINNGLIVGVALPDNAMDYFTAGKAWSNTSQRPDPNEGHCIVFTGYTPKEITAITWAQYQLLTDAWAKKYLDEAFFVVDDPNNPRLRKYIDHAAVRRHLEQVAA